MGSGVGNGLFLRARGWGIDHQERKNLQIPGGISEGWLQAKLNHVILPSFYSKIFIPLTQQFTCAQGRLYSSAK